MNVGSLVGAFQQAKEALFKERDRALGSETPSSSSAPAHASNTSAASGRSGGSQDPMVIT